MSETLPICAKLRAPISVRTPAPTNPDGPEAAEIIEQLYGHAEFLAARVRDLESSISDGLEEASSAYYGHVVPALARMESELAQARGQSTHIRGGDDATE